jgi:nitrate reductase beta subunit
MFGWGVEQAIATYRTAAEDRKLLGALMLFGATPEISHYFRVDGDHVIGYDAKQAEIVRVPLKEPVVIREVYDIKHKAFRTNIT